MVTELREVYPDFQGPDSAFWSVSLMSSVHGNVFCLIWSSDGPSSSAESWLPFCPQWGTGDHVGTSVWSSWAHASPQDQVSSSTSVSFLSFLGWLACFWLPREFWYRHSPPISALLSYTSCGSGDAGKTLRSGWCIALKNSVCLYALLRLQGSAKAVWRQKQPVISTDSPLTVLSTP